MSLKKRLEICEAVIAGTLPLAEARRRRAQILNRTPAGDYCCGSSGPSAR
jgi:hypothetical protein